jgi:hypothetical protein
LNEKNEVDLNVKYYDHFRGASGDERLTNREYGVLEPQPGASKDTQLVHGEYRVLEPLRGSRGDEQPINDKQPTNGEYRVLESQIGTSGDKQLIKVEQPTNGEYRMLEPRRGTSADEQLANEEQPINDNGEYRVLELHHSEVNSGERSEIPSENNSHGKKSNYFEIESEISSIQNPKNDAYFVLKKEIQ